MKVFVKKSPLTGEELYSVKIMEKAEVETAVSKAKEGFEIWGKTPLSYRVKVLKKLKKIVKNNTEELAKTVEYDAFKVETDALIEVFTVLNHLDFAVKKGWKYLRKDKRGSGYFKNKRCYTEFSPYGVVGIISPWNYPLILTATPVIFALLAGNSVVLKPSEYTLKTAEKFLEFCIEAGVPEKAVILITGDGTTGRALVESGGTDLICFTGSTGVGIEIAKICSSSLKPYILELGGKDNAVVFADADLKRAVSGICWGAVSNAGQTCIGVENVLVEESIYSDFLNLLVKEMQSVEKKDMGAIINPLQMEKIKHHIEDAVNKGAKVLCGGEEWGEGYFKPTVVVDVDFSMKIAVEETFGPVVTVVKFKDIDDLIEKANSTEYGLNGSIWTKDSKKAKKIASLLETGNVCINDCLTNYLMSELPFGGVKKSGAGKVHGVEGVRAFARQKSVMIHGLGLRKELWWYPYSDKIVNLFKKAIKVLY